MRGLHACATPNRITLAYEEGFEALSHGDYRRAIDLLGAAAAETALASDLINHAYTLALYRAGEHARLADVAFSVGRSLVSTDPASAMDYFQRAIQAGLDPDRTRLVGEIHEEWAGERRAEKLQVDVTRVGHVVSAMTSDDPVTRYLRILVESLNTRGIESLIFTTEANAAWFINPTASPITPAAGGRVNGRIAVATLEGDFLQRAEDLANAIQNFALPVVFYHTNLSDQIATRVAGMRPSPLQVTVNHSIEVDSGLFDGVIHFSRHGLELGRKRSGISEWIPPASDIERRLEVQPFESRESLGIESASTVSVSFAGPLRTQLDFVKALIEVMHRFPKHFHLFAGAGEVRAIRGLLHAEGVLSRMRFLGPVSDVTRLLRLTDVCFVPFPDSGIDSILDVMGAGKPVLALRHPSNSQINAAADLIGEVDLTPSTSAEYIQRADRLIRDTAIRAHLGEKLRVRFQQEFTPDRLGERYLRFLGKLR